VEALRGEMVRLNLGSTVLLPTKKHALTSVRNRGEIAEGWYEPETFEKAKAFVAGNSPAVNMIKHEASGPRPLAGETERSSDEDELGPALPGAISKVATTNKRSGPTIPNLQDLELQRGASPLCENVIKNGLIGSE